MADEEVEVDVDVDVVDVNNDVKCSNFVEQIKTNDNESSTLDMLQKLVEDPIKMKEEMNCDNIDFMWMTIIAKQENEIFEKIIPKIENIITTTELDPPVVIDEDEKKNEEKVKMLMEKIKTDNPYLKFFDLVAQKMRKYIGEDTDNAEYNYAKKFCDIVYFIGEKPQEELIDKDHFGILKKLYEYSEDSDEKLSEDEKDELNVLTGLKFVINMSMSFKIAGEEKEKEQEEVVEVEEGVEDEEGEGEGEVDNLEGGSVKTLTKQFQNNIDNNNNNNKVNDEAKLLQNTFTELSKLIRMIFNIGNYAVNLRSLDHHAFKTIGETFNDFRIFMKKNENDNDNVTNVDMSGGGFKERLHRYSFGTKIIIATGIMLSFVAITLFTSGIGLILGPSVISVIASLFVVTTATLLIVPQFSMDYPIKWIVPEDTITEWKEYKRKKKEADDAEKYRVKIQKERDNETDEQRIQREKKARDNNIKFWWLYEQKARKEYNEELLKSISDISKLFYIKDKLIPYESARRIKRDKAREEEGIPEIDPNFPNQEEDDQKEEEEEYTKNVFNVIQKYETRHISDPYEFKTLIFYLEKYLLKRLERIHILLDRLEVRMRKLYNLSVQKTDDQETDDQETVQNLKKNNKKLLNLIRKLGNETETIRNKDFNSITQLYNKSYNKSNNNEEKATFNRIYTLFYKPEIIKDQILDILKRFNNIIAMVEVKKAEKKAKANPLATANTGGRLSRRKQKRNNNNKKMTKRKKRITINKRKRNALKMTRNKQKKRTTIKKRNHKRIYK
jgi:hypothetical protein